MGRAGALRPREEAAGAAHGDHAESLHLPGPDAGTRVGGRRTPASPDPLPLPRPPALPTPGSAGKPLVRTPGVLGGPTRLPLKVRTLRAGTRVAQAKGAGRKRKDGPAVTQKRRASGRACARAPRSQHRCAPRAWGAGLATFTGDRRQPGDCEHTWLSAWPFPRPLARSTPAPAQQTAGRDRRPGIPRPGRGSQQAAQTGAEKALLRRTSKRHQRGRLTSSGTRKRLGRATAGIRGSPTQRNPVQPGGRAARTLGNR